MAALSVYRVVSYSRKGPCFVLVHGISDVHVVGILFLDYCREARIHPFFPFAVQNLSGCCIFLVAGRYCTVCAISFEALSVLQQVERMSASKR